MDVYARDGIDAYIGESLGLMRGLSIQIGHDQDKKNFAWKTLRQNIPVSHKVLLADLLAMFFFIFDTE